MVFEKCRFLINSILFLLLVIHTNLLATHPFCRQHWDEIKCIRNEAQLALIRSNEEGGDLFNTSSFMYNLSDFSYDQVYWRRTYSEFSEVFHRFINISNPTGLPALYEGYLKVTELFFDMYSHCIANHNNVGAFYERGKIYFDKGLYENCLKDVQTLVASTDWDFQVDVKYENEFLLMQGTAFLESSLYDDAIYTLSNLIDKDPNNKEAYFNRALAYFETGNFDYALKDYIISENSKKLKKIRPKISEDFSKALANGLLEGSVEAANEFFPSLLDSVYGLGEGLWTFVQEPLNSTASFCNASYEIGEAIYEYAKTLDLEQVEDIAKEVKSLYCEFDQMNDEKKGQLIGYCIGKYGVNIFAGVTSIKGVIAIKNLRYANRVANLEALLASEKSKEIIKNAALVHSKERQEFFKNVKMHWDKQNKHVFGKHNYENGRSLFEHKDGQGLLTKFAGKGKAANDKIPGIVDYRERVDFGEFIGYYIKTDEPNIKLPTTKGIIHYGKKGAHIVPANPEGY